MLGMMSMVFPSAKQRPVQYIMNSMCLTQTDPPYKAAHPHPGVPPFIHWTLPTLGHLFLLGVGRRDVTH